METRDDSGHFRIMFLGYRAGAPGLHVDGMPADPVASCENASEEDEKAYFQADISWIKLGGGGVPQSSVLTAMITGDVRGLGKSPGREESRSSKAGGLPLSLGTYALAAGRNAVAIGNPAVLGNMRPEAAAVRGWSAAREAGPAAGLTGAARSSRAADTCRLDLPLTRPSRSRIVFIDFGTARDLADTDQGFGKGIFPVTYREDTEMDGETTLYFRIDRL